eukprot:TRINITY_DN25092_c0_g1_i1.p1 TRINITY_DN25092_c0_g1~~TRINITY_DN25092_c0_g1_i1.p1  ORF type:complete len:120 (-),score=17.69 TRINITY_DN25092_c0_g1_i1:5-322(-)
MCIRDRHMMAKGKPNYRRISHQKSVTNLPHIDPIASPDQLSYNKMQTSLNQLIVMNSKSRSLTQGIEVPARESSPNFQFLQKSTARILDHDVKATPRHTKDASLQ